MGFFGGDFFDLNGDGKVDGFEAYVGMEILSSDLDDVDGSSSDDSISTSASRSTRTTRADLEFELEIAGIDPLDFEDMDETQRIQVLEEAGLDPFDYDDF